MKIFQIRVRSPVPYRTSHDVRYIASYDYSFICHSRETRDSAVLGPASRGSRNASQLSHHIFRNENWIKLSFAYLLTKISPSSALRKIWPTTPMLTRWEQEGLCQISCAAFCLSCRQRVCSCGGIEKIRKLKIKNSINKPTNKHHNDAYTSAQRSDFVCNLKLDNWTKQV